MYSLNFKLFQWPSHKLEDHGMNTLESYMRTLTYCILRLWLLRKGWVLFFPMWNLILTCTLFLPIMNWTKFRWTKRRRRERLRSGMEGGVRREKFTPPSPLLFGRACLINTEWLQRSRWENKHFQHSKIHYMVVLKPI